MGSVTAALNSDSGERVTVSDRALIGLRAFARSFVKNGTSPHVATSRRRSACQSKGGGDEFRVPVADDQWVGSMMGVVDARFDSAQALLDRQDVRG
jgi:hypothetical protein